MTTLRIALLISLMGSGARLVRAEDLTISTYYPSPRGVYQELRTTNNAFLATQGGAVGIGTTAPAAGVALEVGRNAANATTGIRITGGSLISANPLLANPSLVFNYPDAPVDARLSAWYADDIGAMNFSTSTDAGVWTPRMTILRNGNVGIGTTSPGQTLHVNGAERLSNGASVWDLTPAPGTNNPLMIIDRVNNVRRAVFLTNGAVALGGPITTDSGSFATLFVDSGGSVGIGTTNPQATLHVGGNQGLADNRNFRVTYPAGGALTNTELAGLANLQTDLGVGWSALYARQGAASYAAVVNGTSIFMNGNMSVGNGNVGVGTTNPTSISGLSPVVNISGTAPGILLTDTNDANGNYELYANSFQFIMTRNSGNPATDHPMAINRRATNSFGVALPGQSTNGVCHEVSTTTTDGLGDYLMDCNGAASDIAEWYDTEPNVELGDLVAVSDKTTAFEYASGIGTVLNDRGNPIENALFPGTKKSIAVLKKADGRSALIGIVSTAPYQTFGEDVQEKAKHPQRIALVGRVPVKVSTEHGPIQIGDHITLSSLPGVGMKAVEETSTIGIVLEAFDGSGAEAVSCGAYRCGKSLVFVNVGEGNVAAKVSRQQRQIEDLQSRLAELESARRRN